MGLIGAGKSATWILLAGLPGSGKSTLAQRLAGRLERAIILNKDHIREALFPGPMTDYSAEQDDLCMRVIMEAARYLTRRNQASYIFFDGRTFSRKIHIEEVLKASESAGAKWRILHLTCTDEIAEARLLVPDPNHPARNRNMALYRRVKAAFEPIQYSKLDLDTSAGIENILDCALAYIQS
jgi:adenylylsulfate kinase